mmetsp:Transcript_9198/g.21339  ORF Transcript_9198/g.21339 Transcript_9198/m.21339 type:complete len:125 (-) Transcript_9198:305-679(-)
MNKPDDFDSWRLPDDDSVQKVSCRKDTKVPNAMMVVIEREDHTLGNMLRMQLLDEEQVLFAGYRVPHPLEPAIQLKIQTRSDKPGPTKVVHAAIENLESELQTMRHSFKDSLSRYSASQQSGLL